MERRALINKYLDEYYDIVEPKMPGDLSLQHQVETFCKQLFKSQDPVSKKLVKMLVDKDITRETVEYYYLYRKFENDFAGAQEDIESLEEDLEGLKSALDSLDEEYAEYITMHE